MEGKISRQERLRDHYPLCGTSISVVDGDLSRNSWGEEWLNMEGGREEKLGEGYDVI